MKKYQWAVLALSGLWTSWAYAQNVPHINQVGTLVELCASAEQEVAEDAARVQVSYKADHEDKRIAADNVNKTMSAVIQKIKAQYPNAKVTNQNYNTYQQYTSKGKAKDWTVEQSFTIESKAPQEMPSLVSLVQEAGIVVNGLEAYLTPEVARATQEKLYDQAFADVKLRLNAVSNAVSKPNSWQITHVDTTGQRGCGGARHVPMMARAKADSAEFNVAQPTLEVGKQTVQLSIWVAAKMQ